MGVSVVEAQARRVEIVQARRVGVPWDELATRYSISVTRARELYRRGLYENPHPDVVAHRAEQMAVLDRLSEKAHAILDGSYITVQNGKVVELDGAPVRDVAPNLNAIDTILRIEARRARLLGLDAPVKAHVAVESVQYTIVGVDPSELT